MSKQSQTLWPREHGAYAELAFPLVTALLLGRASAVGLLLTAFTLSLFIGHEALLVLLGVRGRRLAVALGGAAKRRVALLSAVALASGGAALWLAEPATRWAMLLPAALAVAVGALVLSRQEKSGAGEVIVAVAFSAAAVPVALAGGVPLRTAAWSSLAWATSFSVATFAVRLTLERARRERGPMRIAAPLSAALAIAAAGATYLALETAALATIPVALLALWVWAFPVPAKRLRTLGWCLVASNFLVLALLWLGA